MIFQPIKFTQLGLLALMLVGCAGSSSDIYHWGRYENAIYEMYLEPGKTSLTDEILRLEEEIEKADASGKAVPPGFHAHLAYLYVSNGNYATGMTHFKIEKEKFPESAVFIDGILERMKK